MPETQPFGVAPERAIAYLLAKVALPTETWSDLWEGMHAAAFVVAGATKQAIVEDFHEAVTRAIAEGRTLDRFQEDFDRIVEQHGWSYRGRRGWRSRVIYATNMRTAHAAGEWARIQNTKRLLPYLRYVTMDDEHVRHQHAAWHNVVLPVDHPWWETHYPPNGWGCRCRVEALSERMLKRLNLTVTDPPPEIELEPRVIDRDTEPVEVMVPKGIDPGWAYNPGIAGFGRGANQRAVEISAGWQDLAAPGAPTGQLQELAPEPVELPRIEPAQTKAEFIGRLRAVLGGDEAIYTDPLGARVRVGAALAQHMIEKDTRFDGRERYFGLIPTVISDPAEIWIGWAEGPTGKVSLRRRYVRVVQIERNLTVGIVADVDKGEWIALTFFRGKPSATKRLRTGLRIFSRLRGRR